VHDQDISRRVAVKRLLPEATDPILLARFVEEIRTVGRLEHPNIVPIHDVGVDEEGNYFFVMKYVEGETLEAIIERLAAGDREAHRRYTYEARVQIFIGLLRALAYAHDRGILHRDIKPANVMVGRYGEVVLMDWGISRPIDGKDLPPAEGEAEAPVAPSDTRQRLVRTQHNALVGTPSYMSPEQARGSADLDARSDLYSAAVVFHELLTLRHYLADKTTVQGVLVGVLNEELPPIVKLDRFAHPTQGIPPVELLYLVVRGMSKDRDARWQTAMEMIAELEAALEGRVRVRCPMTFTKRVARESGRFVDRSPRLAFLSLIATTGVVLFGLASAIAAIVT
jgi:serine/threonine-protein kinase